MRLGCTPEQVAKEAALRGFNEAEAHAPRMLVAMRDAVGVRPSFNEAEAHAPRMREPPAIKAPPYELLQ